MKKLLFLIIIIILSGFYVHAQEKCAANNLLEKHIQQTPSLRAYIDQYLQSIREWITNYPFNPQLHRNAVTIPVVVHVLYKNASENISNDLIIAQLEALSKDFRKRNADLSTVPDVFRNVAADNFIQFRLATRAPNGSATTGINKISTTRPYFLYDTDEIKKPANGGVAPWDTRRYLNIWVGDLRWTVGGSVQDNLNGYGTFPEDSTAIHGVAMDYTQFGTNAAAYVADRTWAHEIGHFFGLRHIWGDANCGNDLVADTPTQQQSNSGCPTFPQVTCSNGPNGDMFMNFMDYSSDACRKMFTNGQRARMLANLAPGAARASLAVSNGLFPVNAQSRNYQVFLEPQSEQLPSWKAALAMIHGWACQCSPAIDQLVQMNASQPGRHIAGIPNQVSEVIHALALTPQEIMTCYSVDGFYRLLQRPVALISVGANEHYGLVIHGIEMNSATGRAILKIKDPMNIGPRGFMMVNQQGSEYNVDYQEFMLETLERLGENGRRVFIVSPPASSI